MLVAGGVVLLLVNAVIGYVVVYRRAGKAALPFIGDGGRSRSAPPTTRVTFEVVDEMAGEPYAGADKVIARRGDGVGKSETETETETE
ncbi:MAG: hypothetical protein ABEK02_01930, partial [Haloquadratum sp.]